MSVPSWSSQSLGRLAIASCSLLASASSLFGAESAIPKTAAAREAAAEALVEEALIAEVDGRDEDRAALLAKAEALVPELPAVQWRRGMVLIDGKWTPAEDVAVSSEDRALLAEYVAKRDATENTLSGQFALSKWCQKNELFSQERAHLVRVLMFDPNHSIARARLDFVRVGDEWASREAIARALAEEAKAQASMKKHRGWLYDVVRSLSADDAAVQERALERVRAARDVEMIPALETLVAPASEEAALAVVEALSAMPEKDATLSLARVGVLSQSPKVRRRASQRLKGRDFDDFVPHLIASMAGPVRTDFQVVRQSGDGRMVLRQWFYRESMQSGEALVRDVVYVGSERWSNPQERANNRMAIDEAFRDAAARTSLTSALVLVQNSDIRSLNARLGDVLETATGMQLGADAQRWWDWWNQYEELSSGGEKQVQTRYDAQIVQLPTDQRRIRPPAEDTAPRRVPGALDKWVVFPAISCFVAGTPILTNRGDVAIEQVRVGDLVLAQDVETGELAFKPVLETTVRPPAEILRIEHEGGSLRCTGGHPFWVSGEGWVHARRLQSGMELHAPTGTVRVSEVVADGEEPAYNLIVADFANYFVGKARILSHDNPSRLPTDAVVPGLAQR